MGTKLRNGVLAALDFADGRTPCAATLFLIFRTLDIAAYESALGRWAEGILQGCGDTIRAIDGKTLRGSKKQGASGTHLLSVVSQALGLTVQQEAVNDKTNEIGAMLSLVRGLVLDGRIFTMDALLTWTCPHDWGSCAYNVKTAWSGKGRHDRKWSLSGTLPRFHGVESMEPKPNSRYMRKSHDMTGNVCGKGSFVSH